MITEKTILVLASKYNIITTYIPCGCVPENISFYKIWGVKIPCLIPQVNFRGSFDPWPPGSGAAGRWRYNILQATPCNVVKQQRR